MKTRLSLIICVIALAGSVLPTAAQENLNIINKPLKSVKTFGYKNLPYEYILNDPVISSLAVTANNDIMIIDDHRVKVYDENGNPKTIFGGPGTEPGQFYKTGSDNLFRNWDLKRGDIVSKIFLNHTCFVSVLGTSGKSGIHAAYYYRPDYSFVQRVDFNSNPPYMKILKKRNLKQILTKSIYIINDSDRVYSIDSYDLSTTDPNDGFALILFEQETGIEIIAEYKVSYVNKKSPENFRNNSTLSLRDKEYGSLELALLPNEKIVYLHTLLDAKLTDSGAEYTMTMYSLETGKKSFITIPFIPVKNDTSNIRFREGLEQSKKNEILEDFINLFGHKPLHKPVINLRTDGDYIYVLTTNKCQGYEHNRKVFSDRTDIINSKTGKYISSAHLNGYAFNGYLYRAYSYKPRRKDAPPPSIEKFRIKPSVYGK
jgi:hypothetical protein